MAYITQGGDGLLHHCTNRFGHLYLFQSTPTDPGLDQQRNGFLHGTSFEYLAGPLQLKQSKGTDDKEKPS